MPKINAPPIKGNIFFLPEPFPELEEGVTTVVELPLPKPPPKPPNFTPLCKFSPELLLALYLSQSALPHLVLPKNLYFLLPLGQTLGYQDYFQEAIHIEDIFDNPFHLH